MNKLYLLLLLLCGTSMRTQAMELSLPERQAQKGETIQLALKAKNFSDIVSIQFSLVWDASIMTYEGFQPEALEQIAVGDISAEQGELRLSWFDIQGVGVDLPDESTIVLLNFVVTGENGQSTAISFTKEPLDIQIYQGSNGDFTEVDLSPSNGLVEVVAALSIRSETGQVGCFGDSNGFINVAVAGDIEGYNIDWTGPEGFSSDQLSISDLAPGDYHLEISDADGNTLLEEAFSITAPLSALDVEELVTAPTGCGEPSGQLNVQASGGTPPYQFDIGEGPVAISQFNGLVAGDYQLTIIDANDCQFTQDFSIAATEVSKVELGEDARICSGETLLLDAGTHQRYTWSTGERSATIEISESGIYKVTVSDGTACVSSDTIEIIVTPDIELVVEEPTLQACPGEPVILRVSGGGNYQWTDTSGSLVVSDPAQPIATPQASSRYAVMAENECSMDTASVLVSLYEVTANAGADTCVAPGATAQLNASGGMSYEWAESDYPLSAYDIPNPTVEPEDSSTYVVVITDENACQVIDSVTVLVAADPLQFVKRINMLTPNGDGKNDVLEFKGIEKYISNQLTVYNRWGDVLYSKLNYQNDEERFDGTFKGKPLPAGTYYYVLAFREGEIKQSLVILYE
ncbi:MAG: gliding motility-associated C-terminal domain-containing protein [Bacteroidota bacterium]